MELMDALKLVPWAVVIFGVSSLAGGVGAWYNLSGEVRSLSEAAQVRYEELHKHEHSDEENQKAVWNKLNENQKETNEALRDIRQILMVPPGQRAKVFGNQ
jgi:hypothetical protein